MSAPKKPRTMPAVVGSAQIGHTKAVDVVPALLSELQKAEQIILAMLNAMTSAQKSKVLAKLDAAGVAGEGMTRHHERRAVIVAAEAGMAQPAAEQVQPDAESECWMPVGSGTMPPFELAVVAWDSSRGKPCAVWRNPDEDGWFSQEDGSRYDDDDITHWRYCNSPYGSVREGGDSMSAPKKPAKRAALAKSVVSDARPSDLTPVELNLLKSIRAMNDSSAAFIGRTAASLAEKTPRRVTPTLRLIAGGAA